MTTPSNTSPSAASGAVPDASIQSAASSPASIPLARLLYWSVRRELWEFRSIYIAPLAAAGLSLFGFLLSTVHLPRKMHAALALDAVKQNELLAQPYHFAALLIMGSTFLVSFFYCLDALHGERRDRSILFWKSLPVSDLATVLSKACIPLLVFPLVGFVITVVTQFIIFVGSGAVLLGSGISVNALPGHISLLPMWVMLFFHLFAIHGLWYAPIFGWLLLVSAWARRAPFIWATLPLLAVGIVEKIAFDTSHFANLVQSRFMGGADDIPISDALGTSIHPLSHLELGNFLSNPGLWLGLAITAIFLAVAVRLRRYRDPI
jgi:ABC-2 type transport system permease protein